MFTQSNLDEFEARLDGAIQDDPENGIFRCRRDIFTDEELFELEIKHIFEGNWIYMAHESQIPEPGDYFTLTMGRTPVVITRDKEGELHALVNACSHRGAQLCRFKRRNQKTFTCPFHGWTFSNTGKLLKVKDAKGAGYPEQFNKDGSHDLTKVAKEHDLQIMVDAMPGFFISPWRPVVVLSLPSDADDKLQAQIADAFVIGANRTFDADPRFGLVVLSEVAARALSPAVNDPGTAIVIIGSFVRLFANWSAPLAEDEIVGEKYGWLIVTALSLAEMFDDAFTAMARDGAGTVEFGIRLQKAFVSLSSVDDPQMRAQARCHSGSALERAEKALTLDGDLSRLQEISGDFAEIL